VKQAVDLQDDGSGKHKSKELGARSVGKDRADFSGVLVVVRILVVGRSPEVSRIRFQVVLALVRDKHIPALVVGRRIEIFQIARLVWLFDGCDGIGHIVGLVEVTPIAA
jgi:hypothetical protein